MARIQSVKYRRRLNDRVAPGVNSDATNWVATTHGQVTNEMSLRRHKTERLVAVALICAGCVVIFCRCWWWLPRTKCCSDVHTRVLTLMVICT